MPVVDCRSSGLLGRETPRLFTQPLRELTPQTSRGFECIRFAEEILGLTLMPWQKWLLLHALELNEDGSFRFRTLIVLVARQNGKTTLMQVLALWRMYIDGAPLVIGTAQNLDVAEEAWQGAVEMAEAVPELSSEIAHVDRTNGKKQLRLETGERYKVAAANRRGGRGLSGDFVMLDELREHQTWAAWGAVTKTTMARQAAQIAGFSNAGDQGSIVLASLRGRALAAITGEQVDNDDGSLAIFEWSAPDGCALDDTGGWEQANPALGYTITEHAIRGALTTDPEPVFRTEVLCQWVEVVTTVFGPELWESLVDVDSSVPGRPAFAIDVTPDRAWTSIGVAGARADGRTHCAIVQHGRGTRWVAAKAAELAGHGLVAIGAGSPAASLITEIEEHGVRVELVSTAEYVQACGQFYDLVLDGSIRHLGDESLDVAVSGARQKAAGDAWRWSRSGLTDISPLIAVTLATWTSRTSAPAGRGRAIALS